MSPLHLRRYRAERLLRDEFEGLRGQVLGTVRSLLAGGRVTLAEADLEACYATAWQGLYTAILAGESIESPRSWLVTVVFRRAIDEHRARSLPGRRAAEAHELAATAMVGEEQDLAAELDDRMKLRQLLEGITAGMSERERQAAALCCLQGLSRAEAARRMGIGARRMERLMDGAGAGRPGVTAKLGALVETIATGRFCEQQASLMRALAFGVLDPEGERHRLALAHQRSCPACRAYVLQLRGLAAALPPVFLPGLLRLLGPRARAPRARWRLRPRAGRPSGLGSLGTAKLAVTGLVLIGGGVGVAMLANDAGHHGSPAGHAAQAPPSSAAGPLRAGTAMPPARARAHRKTAKVGVDRRVSARRSRRSHVASRPTARATTPVQREFSFERSSAAESGTSPANAGVPSSRTQALREFGIE